MSDLDSGRMTEDGTLGRKIKANLSGLDSFIPAAPPFAEMESSGLRPLKMRGKSGVHARLNLGAAAGLLAAGLVVVVVLGSGAWRPSPSAGAVESPTAESPSASGVSLESGTPATSFDLPTPVASASSSIVVSEASPEASSPWYTDEVYFLGLLNCTRTGGWVTAKGACSSKTHHTLPAQPALVLDAGISDKVARPYAKYLADNDLLDHYLLGTTPQSRLCSAGFCGSAWGENLASPGSYGKDGMVTVEIFYQNEYFCRCLHYDNIMNPHYTRVGIGVWATSGRVRLVIDFSD